MSIIYKLISSKPIREVEKTAEWMFFKVVEHTQKKEEYSYIVKTNCGFGYKITNILDFSKYESFRHFFNLFIEYLKEQLENVYEIKVVVQVAEENDGITDICDVCNIINIDLGEHHFPENEYSFELNSVYIFTDSTK